MKLLRWALAGNAAFSATSGLVLLAGAAPVAALLGDVPAWALRIVGGGLVLFALVVARESRRPSALGVRLILTADAAWVLGSAALVAVRPEWLSVAGLWAVVLVAAMVADFAVLQGVGWRRHARVTSP